MVNQNLEFEKRYCLGWQHNGYVNGELILNNTLVEGEYFGLFNLCHTFFAEEQGHLFMFQVLSSEYTIEEVGREFDESGLPYVNKTHLMEFVGESPLQKHILSEITKRKPERKTVEKTVD
ncbi:hypothetical protein K8R47_01635 [archaeon]|nr:hypothetical protein [archaeon]